MKYLVWILAFVILIFSFWNVFGATNSIFNNSTNRIPYCNYWECWLVEWVNSVRNINAIEKNRSASQYIQDVTIYVLSFLALIATLYIIYAWFNLLTSAWDEDKAKKSKTIILYAIGWLLIIFIAWPLIDFVLNIIN